MIIFVQSISRLIFVIEIHLSMRRDWFFVLLYTSKCQWNFVRSLYTCRISVLLLTRVSLLLLTRVNLLLLTCVNLLLLTRVSLLLLTRVSLLLLIRVSLLLLTRVSLFQLTETTWRKCWGDLIFVSGVCYLVFISRCQWFRYITSNGRLINGRWIGKVVEGRCSGIVRCIVSEFVLRTVSGSDT